MTTAVVSVNPETTLLDAVDLLLKKNFNGLPVVDNMGKLVGILTEYDLVIKGSSLHLPTFIKLFEQFQVYRKDQGPIKDEVKNILKMRVADVMNTEPITLAPEASIEEAASLFSQHHKVNPVPIVSSDGRLVGILSRFDLIKLLGAPSVSLSDNSDQRDLDKNINKFVSDFGRQFVFVSKFRVSHWFIYSLIFAFLGFFIAFAIILRLA